MVPVDVRNEWKRARMKSMESFEKSIIKGRVACLDFIMGPCSWWCTQWSREGRVESVVRGGGSEISVPGWVGG